MKPKKILGEEPKKVTESMIDKDIMNFISTKVSQALETLIGRSLLLNNKEGKVVNNLVGVNADVVSFSNEVSAKTLSSNISKTDVAIANVLRAQKIPIVDSDNITSKHISSHVICTNKISSAGLWAKVGFFDNLQSDTASIKTINAVDIKAHDITITGEISRVRSRVVKARTITAVLAKFKKITRASCDTIGMKLAYIYRAKIGKLTSSSVAVRSIVGKVARFDNNYSDKLIAVEMSSKYINSDKIICKNIVSNETTKLAYDICKLADELIQIKGSIYSIKETIQSINNSKVGLDNYRKKLSDIDKAIDKINNGIIPAYDTKLEMLNKAKDNSIAILNGSVVAKKSGRIKDSATSSKSSVVSIELKAGERTKIECQHTVCEDLMVIVKDEDRGYTIVNDAIVETCGGIYITTKESGRYRVTIIGV